MRNEYLEPLWEAFDTYADYPAVVDRDAKRSTTYRELGELVCRVVAWLGGKNAPEHSFVPVILPSSVEYIAAEIGSWMAGHTAVPMGPSFPAERIAYICEHCESPLVIDEAAWNEIAATEPIRFADGTPDYPPEEVPALLIYTSGSTGNPKGILHTFGGLGRAAHGEVAVDGRAEGQRGDLDTAHVAEADSVADNLDYMFAILATSDLEGRFETPKVRDGQHVKFTYIQDFQHMRFIEQAGVWDDM